jgi:hypothetical protein
MMYSQGGEGGGAPFPWDLTPQEYASIYGTSTLGQTGFTVALVAFAAAVMLFAHR